MVARQNLLLPLVGCLLGFDLSAHAMPTPRARPKEPFSTEEDWHSFWNWKHDQSWIESFQKLECPGMNQNDEYFWKKGSKEFARLPLSNPWDNIKNNGGNNYNIYSVDAKKFTFGGKEYKGDYLVKAVDITSDEGKIVASCEPHAMEQLGIPHHTGILIDRANGQEVGAILMKQKPGGAVVENELWLDAGQEEQQAALASVRVKTKKQLHKYAFETKSNEDRLLPGKDIHNGNVLVDLVQRSSGLRVKGVAMIDWDHTGLLRSHGEKKAIDDAMFVDWFDRQFALNWAVEYYMAGDPSIVNEFLEWRKTRK